MKIKSFLVLLCLALCSLVTQAQDKKSVSGVVRDANGAALPGATVLEKGTKNKVLTDQSGTFSIKTGSNATLIISYVGFNAREVQASGNLSIVMEPIKGNLDEVVVTAMGIQKQKKSLGYATTTIKAAELVKTAPTNIASALYGKAPGVRIATAPGGSLGGVAIQIRGLNSITGKTQPLIIVDGIPIHDGDFNNGNYWGDQRLRGNGLLDVNPDDIESINVLKGASAAALYGAEARNGALIITTKSGKGKKGFAVDFSATYFQDRVAYLPQFQNVRGAGSPVQYDVYGEDANGFNKNTYTINGQSYRALVQGSLNFGPVFDGQPIASWDGVVRPYSPIKNGWAHLFQHANNMTQNLAFTTTGDNSSTRFSFTHQNYEGVSLNSENDKYNINLNSMFNFGKKLKVNFVISDVFSKVKNRPYLDDRLINNFTGMMPTFDDGLWYRDKYQTSMGYKYVTGGNSSLTPNENLKIPNYRTDILDFVWNVMKNQERESNNRLIASSTVFYDIVKNLQLRAKLATDWTSNKSEDMGYSSIPSVYGYSGAYGIGTNNYSIFYGDVLLTYTKQINNDLEMKVMGGYTGDKESGYSTSVSTNGGLNTENRFDLTSSAQPNYNSGSSRSFLVKDGFIGTLNASYKDYLFAEATVRRDRTSTMYPTDNSFVYPSANAAFVISQALKLPAIISYAKLRGSWGIVGGYPAAYQSNVAYSLGNLGVQGSGGSTLITTVSTGTYGNQKIRSEKKNEFEIGLETRFLKDRLNIDVAYYNAMNVDMILPLQIAQSSGASNILSNVGSMRNTGVDLAINGTPYISRNFTWEAGVNFNFNNNKIVKLTDGNNELIHADFDGNAAVLKSVVGSSVGDFYAHPIMTNSKGEPIIVDYGNGEFNYQIDGSKLEKYGNAQIKAVGGFFNNLKYKGFTLDLYTDFRIGGYVMPTALFWMTSRGLTKESLTAMDAEHGGVAYYKDAQGRGIETTASAGPNGEKVYHDGMKLGGVFSDGSANTYVTSQFYYYWDTYNWGGPQYSNSQYFRYILKNTYWKMREISLSYTVPQNIARKVKATKLQVAVFGRNLFYLYRTIKDMDAEQLTSGLSWNASLNNAGSQPSTRTFGVSLKASF